MPFRTTAAFLAAATLAGGAAMALAYELRDGLLIAGVLALMGLPVLAVSHFIARHRRRLGRLSWQFVVGVVVALALDLLGLQFIGTLFLSPRDAFALALMLTFACMLVGFTAWWLIKDMTQDIAEVREAVSAVREGSHNKPVVDLPGEGDDELSALAREFNRMSKELHQREVERDGAEQARRDLIAAVSHDLRTPLSAVMLLARALDDDVGDERTLRRHLGHMAVNLESLNKLIDDLFEFSRMEAGDVAWSFEDLALDSVIEETVEGMRPIAGANAIKLRLSLPDDLPKVRANPERLQRVLFNLIQNAVQHTPDGGEISVVATATSDAVEVDVADTGSGIASDEVERVFEPLWRGGDAGAARSGDGAGLGLPIARSIVEAHGGRIFVADTSASGTRVCFSLPRIAARAAAPGANPHYVDLAGTETEPSRARGPDPTTQP